MPKQFRLAMSEFIALLQATGVILVGLVGAYWANQAQLRTEQRVEIQDQEIRRKEQGRAIAEMSRHIGLLIALCPERSNLLSTDWTREKDDVKGKQCYDTYIKTRSLQHWSRFFVRKSTASAPCDWREGWQDFEESLQSAGGIGFDPEELLNAWNDIIEHSEYGTATRTEVVR